MNRTIKYVFLKCISFSLWEFHAFFNIFENFGHANLLKHLQILKLWDSKLTSKQAMKPLLIHQREVSVNHSSFTVKEPIVEQLRVVPVCLRKLSPHGYAEHQLPFLWLGCSGASTHAYLCLSNVSQMTWSNNEV